MRYDFGINGGGMIGSALALGLAQQGYRVALIEHEQFTPFSPQQPLDLRVSALSLGSIAVLEKLAVWREIQAMRVRAYDQLSVWEQPAQAIHFSASEFDLTQLGFFVENRLLPIACQQALAGFSDSRLYQPQRIEQLTPTAAGWRLRLNCGEDIECQWLIGADGARSLVRQQAGIGEEGWQYNQRALAIGVRAETPFAATTWQQFFPTGPRALLPLYENYACLVWYDQPATIRQLRRLPAAQLQQQILDHFPSLLPPFTVVNCVDFTLTRSHAQRYLGPRCLLVGDAAHTINPLAGQGVNLGFRDIKALLQVSATTQDLTHADFAKALARDYESPRRRDNLLMMSAMDGLYWGFSHHSKVVEWGRKALMRSFSRGLPFKRQILSYALGVEQESA